MSHGTFPFGTKQRCLFLLLSLNVVIADFEHLFPHSETLGKPLSVNLPLPLSSSEQGYNSSSVALSSLTPSLGTSSSTNSSSSTTSTTSSSAPSSSHYSSSVGGSYDSTMPPHTRLGFSQSKEATGPVMVSRNVLKHLLFCSKISHQHFKIWDFWDAQNVCCWISFSF